MTVFIRIFSDFFHSGSDKHNPMGAFLTTVRKAVDEKHQHTSLKKGETRYCFGGCGSRRSRGKLVLSRLTGTNMCVDCLLPDMLDRPEKYHYFIEHWQVNQTSLWLAITMHEALIFSCLCFNDLLDGGDESRRYDGYDRWYRVEIALESPHCRTFDYPERDIENTIYEYRKRFFEAISGVREDCKLRRYVFFDGPGAGFVTFDDVRYAIEYLMTSVVEKDLQLPTAEMVANSWGKSLTLTPIAPESDDTSSILKYAGIWHFMEPGVLDKKMTQSCMDVLHDCYLQKGRIEDFDACKDVFSTRIQSYWKAMHIQFHLDNRWASTYLKTLSNLKVE